MYKIVIDCQPKGTSGSYSEYLNAAGEVAGIVTVVEVR